MSLKIFHGAPGKFLGSSGFFVSKRVGTLDGAPDNVSVCLSVCHTVCDLSW